MLMLQKMTKNTYFFLKNLENFTEWHFAHFFGIRPIFGLRTKMFVT